jgi:homoserine kinase type II
MADVAPFRVEVTPALLELARQRFGLRWDGAPADLGGTNTNVRLGAHVLRVYAPWVTPARVRFVQGLRAALRGAGLPFTETVPALDGTSVVEHGGRAVEVERAVAGIRMDEVRQLEGALPMLARIHDALRDLAATDLVTDAPPDVLVPAYPNHVRADEALDWAQRAATVVRAWPGATTDELATARRLVELAETLAPLEAPLPHQLVHGDFWDNNVLFDGARIRAVLDLDFCGPRPRVDDLALTLYYVTSERRAPVVTADHRRHLGRLVDAYDHGLAHPLTDDERRALPLAIARTVLFMARNLVAVDDTTARRRMLADIELDSRWALDLARRPG